MFKFIIILSFGTLCSLVGTRCTTPVHFVLLRVQDVPHRYTLLPYRYKMYHLGFELQDPYYEIVVLTRNSTVWRQFSSVWRQFSSVWRQFSTVLTRNSTVLRRILRLDSSVLFSGDDLSHGALPQMATPKT